MKAFGFILCSLLLTWRGAQNEQEKGLQDVVVSATRMVGKPHPRILCMPMGPYKNGGLYNLVSEFKVFFSKEVPSEYSLFFYSLHIVNIFQQI